MPHDLGQDVLEAENFYLKSEIRIRGIGKGVFAYNCPKFYFLICIKFATISRTLPLICTKQNARNLACKFGAHVATNLRNAPFANAPFSEFLKENLGMIFRSIVSRPRRDISVVPSDHWKNKAKRGLPCVPQKHYPPE